MKYFLATLAIFLLVGCSATRIAVNNDFWSKENSKIGIAFIQKPQSGAYKVGSQGILDMAINAAMASNLEKHLAAFKVDEFYQLKEIFKERLAKRGITNVIFVDSLINFKMLRPYAGKAGKKASEKDFTSFKDKYNIEHLIVLSIGRYGTLRGYYGFLPLGAPKALFQGNGMMIDLSNNEYEWYIEMDEDESSKDVIGSWDQEPDYPNLTKALGEALLSSKKFLDANFFEAKK